MPRRRKLRLPPRTIGALVSTKSAASVGLVESVVMSFRHVVAIATAESDEGQNRLLRKACDTVPASNVSGHDAAKQLHRVDAFTSRLTLERSKVAVRQMNLGAYHDTLMFTVAHSADRWAGP